IQGEGGVRPLTRAFAAAIAEASERTGALVIADEVQCGLGRTGRPVYFAALGLRPHLVSVGKALRSGGPVGAALVSRDGAATIAFGYHGTPSGGNLPACRAALTSLDQLTTGGVMATAARLGPFFDQRLRQIAGRHAFVKEVRGEGLMWGMELSRDAAPVVPAGLVNGVGLNRTSETGGRLLPPLVITQTEGREGLGRLGAAPPAGGRPARRRPGSPDRP